MKETLPQNLAKFGVSKEPNTDLGTIWKTTYPVLTNYMKLCKQFGIKPFGGGSRKKQGNEVMVITSGYRDYPVNGNDNSAHMYATAIDCYQPTIMTQLKMARQVYTDELFNRVGLYPQNKFIHLDIMPDGWIKRYNKAQYWANVDGKMKVFPTIFDLTAFVADKYNLEGVF